jgi:hypothetical protein
MDRHQLVVSAIVFQLNFPFYDFVTVFIPSERLSFIEDNSVSYLKRQVVTLYNYIVISNCNWSLYSFWPFEWHPGFKRIFIIIFCDTEKLFFDLQFY